MFGTIENEIETYNLTKRYNGIPAVGQLGFPVKRGTAFGFLGPNRACKTTTIKMLVGLIQPDSGTAIVAGHDILGEPMAVRLSIGVVQENQGFYRRMTTAVTLAGSASKKIGTYYRDRFGIDHIFFFVSSIQTFGFVVGIWKYCLRNRDYRLLHNSICALH